MLCYAGCVTHSCYTDGGWYGTEKHQNPERQSERVAAYREIPEMARDMDRPGYRQASADQRRRQPRQRQGQGRRDTGRLRSGFGVRRAPSDFRRVLPFVDGRQEAPDRRTDGRQLRLRLPASSSRKSANSPSPPSASVPSAPSKSAASSSQYSSSASSRASSNRPKTGPIVRPTITPTASSSDPAATKNAGTTSPEATSRPPNSSPRSSSPPTARSSRIRWTTRP